MNYKFRRISKSAKAFSCRAPNPDIRLLKYGNPPRELPARAEIKEGKVAT
jgi:hypothetical protein